MVSLYSAVPLRYRSRCLIAFQWSVEGCSAYLPWAVSVYVISGRLLSAAFRLNAIAFRYTPESKGSSLACIACGLYLISIGVMRFLEAVEYSFDVSNLVECNGLPVSVPSYRHSEILKSVGNGNQTSGLEPIIQPARDRGYEGQSADDHNIVNIYKNKDTMRVTKFPTKDKTRGRNRCLEAEFINYVINDFLKILAICLLDAIPGFIQPDYRAGSTMRIRAIAFRKSHVEDLMERAVEECRRNVEYGYLKIVFCCKAKS